MTEPINIISLGAGVQSSTMALMAAHGEITPMPKCAIFADTQDEPKSVYVWLDWLEKQLPFPVHRVTAGKLSVREVQMLKSAKSGKVYRKSGIPFFMNNGMGPLWRKCTSDFKIVPIIKQIRAVAEVPQGCKTVRVCNWIGVSRDEAHRMKPSRFPFITHRHPLVDMNIKRRDCVAWMKAHGYPTPPRSACYFCPYHSDNEWRRLRKDEPAYFQKAVEFEAAVQSATKLDETTVNQPFLHHSCVPLDQVDFSTDEDHGQQVMFGNECEGMCGV